MIQIRHGSFETNSSSAHSINFSKNNLKCDDEVDKYIDDFLADDRFGLILGSEDDLIFGWGPNVFNDPLNKIRYYAALTYRVGYNNKNLEKFQLMLDDLLRVLKEYYEIDYLCFNLNDYQIKEFNLDITNDFYDIVVDHDSDYVLSEFLESTSIKEYLFSPNIYVVIDNDNSYYFSSREGVDQLDAWLRKWKL